MLGPPLAAVGFLTVLPVPRPSASSWTLRASLSFFPGVGLLLGLVLWGMDVAFDDVLTATLTGAILLVALLVMTRGLHLEGLMDACDGLLGGQTRERRLEIMRDSHAGAFALMGGASLILLKWTALLSIPQAERAWGLILFPCLSRWAMVVAISLFPYARSQGLGTAFQGGSRMAPLLFGGLSAAAAALLLAGWGGVVVFGLATLLALVLGRGISTLLGGLTGDTYGAINEIVEVAVLIALVGLAPISLIEPLHQVLGG